MPDIVFHGVSPNPDSALRVSIDGQMATPEQLDRLLIAINYNPTVKAAVEAAYAKVKE